MSSGDKLQNQGVATYISPRRIQSCPVGAEIADICLASIIVSFLSSLTILAPWFRPEWAAAFKLWSEIVKSNAFTYSAEH